MEVGDQQRKTHRRTREQRNDEYEHNVMVGNIDLTEEDRETMGAFGNNGGRDYAYWQSLETVRPNVSPKSNKKIKKSRVTRKVKDSIGTE